MNMQDNELDNLFRSKLSGLEVKPAAKVWANIESELGGGTKRKSWAPVISMAATVLVVLSAGTWFLLDKPVKQQPNQVAKRIVRHSSNYKNEALTETDNTVVEPVDDAQVIKAEPVQSLAHLASNKPFRSGKKTESKVITSAAASINEDVNKTAVLTAPVLAAMPDKPVVHPVVPDVPLTIAMSTTEDEPPVGKAIVPVVIATAQPEKTVKKRGIRSLGGLINAVIAKIDKREDKLIEFTETDEDQANITGVNLGIIRIKKEK
jgi:hypothetical protein